MAETLISPGISLTEVDQSVIAPRPLVAGAAIIGPTVKGRINIPTLVTSYPAYKQIFGETFLYESGSETYTQEFLTSLAAKNYFEQGGDSLLVTRVAPDVFLPAISTTVVVASGSSVPFSLETLSPGAIMNNATSATFNSESLERSDGSLISGSADNIRWSIDSINNDQGTFNLTIRRGDDNAREQIILESFMNLSLDPMNPNFISKVVGDQAERCVVDSITGEAAIQVVSGSYPNMSKYVRVASVSPIVNYLNTDGSVRQIDANTSVSSSLPKEQEGCFYHGAGIVGACYTVDRREINPSGKAYYFGDLKKTEDANDYNQGVKSSDYSASLALMKNTDEYQINILSAPGYFGAQDLIDVAEYRTDCIAVVDTEEMNTPVANVAARAAATFNSSYGATYWPWVQMISATGRFEWCPASTVIPGVYTYTDHQTAPWYAPAGMNRGGVYGVIQTSRKLTKSERDTLYSKNVNPIAVMPGAGIVVYGQKTLQRKASALDRVNVRRLLIEVKDTVRRMASSLLFEQNTVALQNEFKAKVDPYLASIVQRKGLVAYKIDLSENTPDVIDRNEFRCSIMLAPTKSIEFIYLTFTVTATGVSFG